MALSKEADTLLSGVGQQISGADDFGESVIGGLCYFLDQNISHGFGMLTHQCSDLVDELSALPQRCTSPYLSRHKNNKSIISIIISTVSVGLIKYVSHLLCLLRGFKDGIYFRLAACCAHYTKRMVSRWVGQSSTSVQI